MGLYTHNYVANGNLQVWDSGPVPAQMDAQVTNTTITRLQRSFNEERPERYAWTEISGERSPGGDRFIYQGSDALRATLASSSADDFRLHPEGVSATAWTGTCAVQLPVVGGHRYRLAVAARSDTDGALLTIRIVGRETDDTVTAHLQSDGTWAASPTTGTDLGLGPRWGVVGVTFQVPLGLSNEVIENVVWQISNGTSGSLVYDIGEIRLEDLTIGYSSR